MNRGESTLPEARSLDCPFSVSNSDVDENEVLSSHSCIPYLSLASPFASRISLIRLSARLLTVASFA